MNIFLFVVKIYFLEPLSPFYLSRLNVVWTNTAGLGTTYNVASWDNCICLRRMEMVSLMMDVGHSIDDSGENPRAPALLLNNSLPKLHE
jgi:hypothetical protein